MSYVKRLIRLDPDLDHWLAHHAHNEERSIASIVRLALRRYRRDITNLAETLDGTGNSESVRSQWTHHDRLD